MSFEEKIFKEDCVTMKVSGWRLRAKDRSVFSYSRAREHCKEYWLT